ncbi:MAG: mechanosensitive ion channel family protein, partial [Acidobacteriota bacterium]
GETPMSEILDSLPPGLLEGALRVALVALGGAVLVWLTSRFIAGLEGWIRTEGELGPTEGEKRVRTLGNVVRYTVTLLAVIVVVVTILAEVGIELAPLLATAGVAGIVIGLGAQNLVRDWIAGVFVLLENQYAVGDVVQIGGTSGPIGTVERITLRMTQMRDIHGNVHFVPNGEVRIATNMTKEWSKALLDVGVAYKEDVDRVMEVLRGVGDEMAEDETWGQRLLEPLAVLGVQQFADSAVLIRISFKTLPLQQWEVARELRRRIKIRFDEEGIEIPFPHRTLYVGTGEAGTLRVDAAAGPATPAPGEPGATEPEQG